MSEHVESAATRAHAEALQLVRQGRNGQAIRKLTAAARQAPEDSRIHADLIRILILEQRLDQAEDIARNLPPTLLEDRALRDLCTHIELINASTPAEKDIPKLIMNHYMELETAPGRLDTRLELASILFKIDDIESALEQLYQIHLQDRGFRNDIGHRGMQALFSILGDGHELVREYRRRLQ